MRSTSCPRCAKRWGWRASRSEHRETDMDPGTVPVPGGYDSATVRAAADAMEREFRHGWPSFRARHPLGEATALQTQFLACLEEKWWILITHRRPPARHRAVGRLTPEQEP